GQGADFSPPGRCHPHRAGADPGRPAAGAAPSEVRAREHRPAPRQQDLAVGSDQHAAREAARRESGQTPADRHARAVRGPAPVRWQPAEGRHRALAGRRIPDAAVLRPHARHRHRDQAPDLRTDQGAGGRRLGRAAVHVRAAGDPARLQPRDRAFRRQAGRRDARRRGRRKSLAARGAWPACRSRRRARGVVASTAVAEAPRPAGIRFGRAARRYGWTVAVYALFALLMVITIAIKPDYGSFEWNTLTLAALPLAFAAVAQTIVVLSGGIDLSVGPLMALANVLALRAMLGHDLNYSLVVALIVLLEVTLAGALNGAIIVVTRVPDIVITLATSFIWAGLALLVLAKPTPGIPLDFQNLAQGSTFSPWVPNALLVLLVIPLVWIPLRRSRAGLAIYAVGSDRNAAFRSGVNLGWSRLLAYAVCGFFAACGGLALSMTTG